MDNGRAGYEHERLAAQLADFQRRFYTLEDEHRLALNMLQNSCRFLHEIKEENAALRMQLAYLQGPTRRSDTWTSSTSPSDMEVPLPALLAGGGIHRSPTSSTRDDASSTIAGWSSNRDSYDLLLGMHSGSSREVSVPGQSRRTSRDMSVNADLLQAVQSLMPSGYAAAAASAAAATPQQQNNVFQMRQQQQQQLASLGEPDSAQRPLQPGSPVDGEVGESSTLEPNLQHRQPSSEVSEKAQSRKAFEPWMTTIVVRNVPARYTQERLLEVWEPDGSYNFLYLPYSVRQKRGSGYVFVNFCSHQAANEFWQKVQGIRLPGCEHLKSLDVAVADVQGLENNLRYWGDRKLSRINNANFLPIVFNGTRRVDFKDQVAAFSVSASACSQEIESYNESYFQGAFTL